MKDTPRFTGFLALVAVICVGISLFISSLISAPKIVEVFQKIAYIAADIVIIISSFLYVSSKRNLVYWIIWGVSVTLLILGGFVI